MNEEDKKKIEELAIELYHAKQAETAAKEDRIGVEEEIISILDAALNIGESQSKTYKAEAFKLTIKKDLTYTVDEKAIIEASPESVTKIFDTVPETLKFIPKKYEALRKMNVTEYNKIAQFVTTKPKKTSVTLGI